MLAALEGELCLGLRAVRGVRWSGARKSYLALGALEPQNDLLGGLGTLWGCERLSWRLACEVRTLWKTGLV